jgi:hypothetical protein
MDTLAERAILRAVKTHDRNHRHRKSRGRLKAFFTPSDWAVISADRSQLEILEVIFQGVNLFRRCVHCYGSRLFFDPFGQCRKLLAGCGR